MTYICIFMLIRWPTKLYHKNTFFSITKNKKAYKRFVNSFTCLYKQKIRSRYQPVKVSDKSCLAPPAGLVQTKRLNIVLSSDGAPSASWQSRANEGDRQRHATASGAKRNRRHHLCSHAYSRKYSRFARLDTLGFKTPYFRNLPSKNNTQLFFSVVYRLRLVQ